MQNQNQPAQQQARQERPLAIGLTVLSALGRLVPHAPNVTPLGGSCLFAGSRLGGAMAYLLPLAVMLVTDPFAYWGHGYTMASPVIYASFLINVWIGRQLLGKSDRITPIRVGGSAFLCSLQFFVLTNLALWVGGVAQHNPMYSADFAGFVRCYTMALPFWGRTLAGDLLFSGALFGLYELLIRRTAHTAATVNA
ncbi:MAG TPA: DUF6580 family putative transport protein [Bryobacteraceae bacterium]|jgi:hypothetical protein|nr:DUF6580 family putative transport protein [Bryobacteraceae bacterium]